jgi:cytidylate kinase
LSPIIAIGGLHGIGKSTISKALAEHFELRYISAGEAFRRTAKGKNLTLQEFSKLADKDPSIDLEIDNFIKMEAEKGDAVAEGQLAPWMLKDVADMKIFLTAPEKVRINRIARREKISFDEAKKNTAIREKNEKERYEKYYNIDVSDVSIYDLIFDTSLLRKEETIKTLEAMVKNYISKSFKKR